MTVTMHASAAARRLALLIFCLAYGVFGLNVSIVLVYGPLYIRELDPTRADWLTGLLFALPSFAGFAGHNVWGALYDRHSRPRLFLALALAAETSFLALLLASRSAAALVWLASSFSFFSVALYPASQAWTTLAWEDGKGSVLGKLRAAESAGWGIGTLVSGIVFWVMPAGAQSIHWLFGFCLCCSVVCMAVVLLFPDAATPAKKSVTMHRSLFADLAMLYARRDVMRLAGFMFVLTGANVAFFSYFSLYLCSHLGGSHSLLAASLAGATLSGALLYPIYGRIADMLGRRKLLLATTVGYFAFYGVLCLVRSPLLVAILYMIPIYPATRVAANAWLADLTGSHDRAAGMGLLEGVTSIASIAGPLAGWAAISHLGYESLPLVPLALLATGLSALGLLRLAPSRPASARLAQDTVA